MDTNKQTRYTDRQTDRQTDLKDTQALSQQYAILPCNLALLRAAVALVHEKTVLDVDLLGQGGRDALHSLDSLRVV